VIQIRTDLKRPEISNRILQLKSQGKSFSEIKDILNKEFNLNLQRRTEISNFYYTALKNIKSGEKLKIIQGELTELDTKRQTQIDIIIEQMEKINKIFWTYYKELEKTKEILSKAILKWSKKLDSLDEPDAEIIREIRSTISSNIANISIIGSNILKQLELESRTLGMLTRPSTINISNLEIVTQINQVLKKIEAQGYYLIKPTDEELLKKLIKEGKIKIY